jgi:hypothetical protein
MSKESYLEDYKQFISEVSAENSDYSFENWKSADEKFDKFQNEWHDKFINEFTFNDKVLLTKYNAQYVMYKYKGSFSNSIKDLFGNYKQLEKEVSYYVDNNMEDDLNFLIENANEIGKTATDMLDEILVDLDVEYKAGYSVKLKVNNQKNE